MLELYNYTAEISNNTTQYKANMEPLTSIFQKGPEEKYN